MGAETAQTTTLPLGNRGFKVYRVAVSNVGQTQLLSSVPVGTTGIILTADGDDMKLGEAGFTTQYRPLLDGCDLVIPYNGTGIYAQSVNAPAYISIFLLKES